MAELKPTSFRIDEETASKFKEIAKELEGNQQHAMQKLIETYELQKGKEILTERKADIENFEQHISMLVSMYMLSLEQNQTIRETVQIDFDGQLKSKDSVIQDLQRKIETLETELLSFTEKQAQLEKENSQLTKDLLTYQETCKNLTETKTLLQEKLQEQESKFKTLENKLQETEKVVLENTQLKNTLVHIKQELEQLKQDNKKETEFIQIEHQKELLTLEKSYQKEKEEQLTQYQQEISNYQKEIDVYQKKYFELKEQKTKINEPSGTGTRKKKSEPAAQQ